MSAECPNCKKAISWWKLRDEFACPYCASNLSAKTTGAFTATIVIWILADIPVKLSLYEALGSDGYAGLLARTAVSGVIGWTLAFFIVGRFSTITERHAQ